MAFTWTEIAFPGGFPSSLILRDMVWAPEISTFVAVGAATASTSCIVTSSDGTTWTLRTAPEANSYRAVTWSPSLSLFVAVSSTGTHRVATSPDGVTWTARTAASASSWQAVTWSSTLGMFVATVSSTNVSMTSTDGITWSAGTLPTLGADRIRWVPELGKFFAVSNSNVTSSVRTSTNGTAWTTQTSPQAAATGDNGNSGTAWSPTLNLFVIPVVPNGESQNAFMTSPTGVTWTIQSYRTSTAISSIVWADSEFIATQNGTGYITSPDGITWTNQTHTQNHFWDISTYAASLSRYFTFNQGSSVLGLVGDVVTQTISPSSGIASGGTTLTIGGDGRNGGFQAAGGTVRVRVGTYPSSTPGYPADPSVAGVIIPTDFGVDLADWHPATAVSVTSSTALTCSTPIGQSLKDVLVYLDGLATANVLAWFPSGFTFTNPSITSISPSTGPSTGATPVTVTGSNLFAGNIAGDQGGLFFGNYGTGIGGFAANVVKVNSTTLTCNAPAGFTATPVDVTYVPPHLSTSLSTYTYPTVTLSGVYTYVESWWRFGIPEELQGLLFFPGFSFLSFGIPSFSNPAPNSNAGLPDWLRIYFGYTVDEWNLLLIKFPPFRWWTLDLTPDHNGWWGSTADFGGDSFILESTDRPLAPRNWSEVSTFATGSTAMLGGSPGAACVFNNRLLYPASTYVNSYPTIRLWNGRSDYQLCTIPPTSSGTAPLAVISMLTANGSIYLSTLDSGSSSADWIGRVFSLDITSGTLAPVGAAFPTGHVPYALAFHNGRLWCGTHRQSTSATGKVFWIRPDVDTSWTDDHTLSTGSVASLLGFQGQLYVGTTDAAGTFALLLKRDTSGSYTTVDTGSGGTAKASNGWLALTNFGGTLYASYWNDDTSPVSKIRKSADGSSWSTAYTGSGTSNRPFIGFTQDNGFLLGIAGGLARTGALIRTADGVSWTNETAFLDSSGETALPIFGTIIA